jgi:hypothetical protein
LRETELLAASTEKCILEALTEAEKGPANEWAMMSACLPEVNEKATTQGGCDFKQKMRDWLKSFNKKSERFRAV